MAAMSGFPRPSRGAARAIIPFTLLLLAGACSLTCGGGVTEAPSSITLVPAFPGLPALERPAGLVDVPAHDLFLIVLLDGRVLAVPRDGPWDQPRIVHDQRARTVIGDERGLLSLALDPDFDRNGYVYAWYSFADTRNRLARLDTTGRGDSFAFDAASELVILEVTRPGTYHNGGAIVFDGDGMLRLSIGDGGAELTANSAQDRTNLLGSIIRIDVRGATAESPYRIPPDNPFPGQAGVRPEIWAYGLRNPWRMSIDRETGLLWAGDVGGSRREEINIVRAGGNHGWAFTEGFTCLQREPCDFDRFVAPVWEYDHAWGCAIVGGHVYRGEAVPLLRGWYLFSDYCSRLVWALNADAAASGRAAEPVLLRVGGPVPTTIVAFAEDSRGELYAISFDKRRIYRVKAP